MKRFLFIITLILPTFSYAQQLQMDMGDGDKMNLNTGEMIMNMDQQHRGCSILYSNYFDEVGLVSVAERWDTYNNQPSDQDDVCGQPFEKLYIWQDGVMNPCDADYKSYLTPGNVKSISLAEGWANLGKLRSDMLKGHRTKNIPCDRCGQS